MYYDSGQVASVLLQITSPDGYAIDSYSIPQVIGVFKPDLTEMTGFPVNMSRLGTLTGAYIARFQLPSGLTSVGTYIAVVKYVDAITRYEIQSLHQIVVGTTLGANSVVGV